MLIALSYIGILENLCKFAQDLLMGRSKFHK